MKIAKTIARNLLIGTDWCLKWISAGCIVLGEMCADGAERLAE